jgi:hypothetical protein
LLSTLPSTLQERNLQLFVHPIAPVLKETRAVVVSFMAALKSKASG